MFSPQSTAWARQRTSWLYLRLDDLNVDLAADALDTLLELHTLVAAIGVKLDQEGMQPEHRAHQQHATVAVLYVGSVHQGKQQTLRVYVDMPLLALDLFAGIINRRIDAIPLFRRS